MTGDRDRGMPPNSQLPDSSDRASGSHQLPAPDRPPTVPIPIALRPWNPSDVEHLLRIFVASKDLSTQYPQSVVDLAGAERCLETMLAWEDHRHNFAITVAGAAVGNVGVTAIERRHHTGWVSYFSSGVVRGQRLVSRSATAVANWALTDLGLFRLELGHRVNNPASGRIAVAAGFMLEGCERQKLQYDDERFDVLTYGRLATDPAPVVDAVTIVAEI